MPEWKAHQDCRSYRNTGIFTGENPDQYGNQNAWAVYEDGRLILTLEEADQYTTQAQVDARARLIEAAPKLLEACRKLLHAMEMQEGRETSELHIPQDVAWFIWSEAKDLANAAIAKAEQS